MITEDYVSFETAKLLKEKRFDEECRVWYGGNGEIHENGEMMSNSDCALSSVMCPTLQMAMKWLREVHKLHIRIDRASKYWNYTIRKLRPSSTKDLSYNVDFNTYEQACEAAIKYCLKNFIK